MRNFFVILLIAALQLTAMGNDCSENLTCTPDDPEICVLHSELYCFIKYENKCIWNLAKCKYNLNFKVFALPYCDLENFLCRPEKNEHAT